MDIKSKEIKIVPIGELKPNPNNRNKHSEEQIERLAEIIKYQGFRSPIIVSNQSGFIVAGHGRLMAAQKLGLENAPVIYQDFDSPEQEYAAQVSDNAVAAWAELDFAGINLDLQELGPDFDIDLLGIKDFALDVAEKLDPQCDEDEIPEKVEPITKRGDIWKLGNHRLMCGDSTMIDDVEKLMDGEKADLVFTDPPYGVKYEGGHNQKKRDGIKNDQLSGEDLTNLFSDSLSLACAFSKDHSAFYIWYANGKAVETFSSFSKIPLRVRAVICWYKIKSGLGAFMSQYIPNYEPCIYAYKDGCSPQWFGPTDEKTVWELKKENKNEYHPTQKPVELPERAIKNSSSFNDIVLDLFGGSGSTLIAAEKNNRRSFLMELDPHYCDVIVSRWEKYTGKKAELTNG
jgi:DNA modification methylase